LGILNGGNEGDWCSEIMIKKVGNGGNTRFWLDTWVGERPLCQEFSRLFLVSVQKEDCINQMGVWRNEAWEWDLKWRRRLFVWEENLERNLLVLVGSVILNQHEDYGSVPLGLMVNTRLGMVMFILPKISFHNWKLTVTIVGY
jgi:hypothetical protein